MVDVSIVIPCLNEAQCLDHCIANARTALFAIAANYDLSGEIIVADNGSTDGSQDIALKAGARVVAVKRRGYGAAISGGMHAARGRYLVMADADGSYNFLDCVPMIGRLRDGADLCMGSRFLGGIEPGAMPWKNRYIGNPVLTGILNLFFRSGIEDAHCGIRALTAEAFRGLQLNSEGMEFASEMVIKASLKGLRIAEVPATLAPDLRDRPPHLRPWRDGWRHLRYLMMLAPNWTFAGPALVAAFAALVIFTGAILHAIWPQAIPGFFGNYWLVAASALTTTSHLVLLLGLAAHLHGVKAGYRQPGKLTMALSRLTLEAMLAVGLLLVAVGVAVLVTVTVEWIGRNLGGTYSILPAVLGTVLVTCGMQNIFGGFLLAILADNQSAFVPRHQPREVSSEALEEAA